MSTSIFDEYIDRRQTNSLKWAYGQKILSAEEVAADPLPMWIADSDFRAPPPVIEALAAAVAHGVYGYTGGITEEYRRSFIAWQTRRFGWTPQEHWIVPSAGVIPALKTAIQAFSAPGDSILIQPPVYSHFHTDVLINDRRLVFAPLELTEKGYRFNKDSFEDAIRSDTKLFILSHPHNPTGNVWTPSELQLIGEVCARRNVLVVSDEIHQDLILNRSRKHVPFAALGDVNAFNSITLSSPSKTFNIAGLQIANVLIVDDHKRARYSEQLLRNSQINPNLLAMIAAEAAYTHGEPWLESQLTYLSDNKMLFENEVLGMTSKIRIFPSDATYLAWMDCRGLGMSDEVLNKFMLTKARLWLDPGLKYGVQGHGFMRANLACPQSMVLEAIRRLQMALASL